jgi:hypothetical protein
VGLHPEAHLWLDVDVLEQAFLLVEGVPSRQIDGGKAHCLRGAVQLYRGDLLEGCYLDWCLVERERLQTIYLSLLDKLMGYCEAHQEYEVGLDYGNLILRYDRASERTHRRLMRLQYLVGDRTAALRQYQRCAAALEEELKARPSRTTRALYDQIRADEIEKPASLTPGTAAAGSRPEPSAPLPEVLGCLNQFARTLDDLQRQIQRQIQAVELALKRRL